MVVIRPFNDEDTQAVDALLRRSWGYDPAMLKLYSLHRSWPLVSGRLRMTLVATVDGKTVAAGTLVDNPLHPRMLLAVVNVAGAWQRRGIGTALVKALSAIGDGRPWFVKTTRRDHAGTAFLRQRGFQTVVRTLTGVLDPKREPVRAWLAGLPPALLSCRVFNLAAPECDASVEDLALAHATVYRRSHTWNPPVAEDVQAALAHYCGSDVIEGTHLCAYAGDRLAGAVNLIANPFQSKGDEAYLVNVGVIDPRRSFAPALAAALIHRSLEWAAERNLRVSFEVDDTNESVWSLLDRAPAAAVNRDFVILANG